MVEESARGTEEEAAEEAGGYYGGCAYSDGDIACHCQNPQKITTQVKINNRKASNL